MNFTLNLNANILEIIPELLNSNSEYRITLAPGFSGELPDTSIGVFANEYVFWFTSTYCPQFTTLQRVKLQVGPLADSVIDDTIFRLIHKNSMDAVDLFNISTGNNIAYDFWGCDWQGVPVQVRRYVDCKTAYDLLSLIRMTQSMSGTSGGDQLKTLGDMTIKYGGASAGGAANVDPKHLANLYDCWNDAMRMLGGTAGIKATVKGYYDYSKGYAHPVANYTRNRVLKPVFPYEGNFTPGTTNWRGV